MMLARLLLNGAAWLLELSLIAHTCKHANAVTDGFEIDDHTRKWCRDCGSITDGDGGWQKPRWTEIAPGKDAV